MKLVSPFDTNHEGALQELSIFPNGARRGCWVAKSYPEAVYNLGIRLRFGITTEVGKIIAGECELVGRVSKDDEIHFLFVVEDCSRCFCMAFVAELR